jgi:hypothetical protein
MNTSRPALNDDHFKAGQRSRTQDIVDCDSVNLPFLCQSALVRLSKEAFVQLFGVDLPDAVASSSSSQ